jgi:tRNA(Ile)-lysidine synthase TilS/MesJ
MAENKKFKRLTQKAGKTIYEHRMLAPDDKIMIGLSGGKDSCLLLEILSERRKHLPFPIELFAVHVKIKEINYSTNDSLSEFCKKLNIPFYYIEESIGEVNNKKSPCFLCSWYRRKSIFSLAREHGCNKVAFAHHMDDALQTFLLNLIYHASICSLPFQLSMFGGEITLIRPLLELTEKEILSYTITADYPLEISPCQYKQNNKREQMKELLNKMRQIHPIADKNLFRSMRNVYEEYIP